MHKKILVLIMVVVLLLIGCSKGGDNNNNNDNTNEDKSSTNMIKDGAEDKAESTYTIVLSKEMEEEAEAMNLSNEQILSLVQKMTQEEADRLGMSLEAYLEYLDERGQTAFSALKEAMESSGVNFKTMHEAQAMLDEQEADRDEAADFKWEISEEMTIEAVKLNVEPSEVLQVTRAFAELDAANAELSLEDHVENLMLNGITPFELLKTIAQSSGMDIFELYEFALAESQEKDRSDTDDVDPEIYDTTFITNLFYNLYYQAHDVVKEDKWREDGKQTHLVHYYSDEPMDELLHFFAERLEIDKPEMAEAYNLNAIFGKHTAMVNIKPSDRNDFTSYVEVEVVEYEKEAEDLSGHGKVEPYDFSVDDYMIGLMDFLYYGRDSALDESVNYQENLTLTAIEYFSYKSVDEIKNYYEALFGLDAEVYENSYKLTFERDGNTIEIAIGEAGVDDYKAYIYTEVIEKIITAAEEESDPSQQGKVPGPMTDSALSLEDLQGIESKALGDVTVKARMMTEVQNVEVLYYKLGNKERVENDMGFGKFITVYEPGLDQSYEYSEISNEGYLYDGNMVKETVFGMNTFAFNLKEDVKAKWTELNGEEVLYVQAEVDDMMFDVWFNKEYLIPNKYILSSDGMAYLTYEMTDLQSGKVDESLFDIPEGINFIEE